MKKNNDVKDLNTVSWLRRSRIQAIISMVHIHLWDMRYVASDLVFPVIFIAVVQNVATITIRKLKHQYLERWSCATFQGNDALLVGNSQDRTGWLWRLIQTLVGPWCLTTSLRRNRDLFSMTFLFVCRFLYFSKVANWYWLPTPIRSRVLTKSLLSLSLLCLNNVLYWSNFSCRRGNFLYPPTKQFWRRSKWIRWLVNTSKDLSTTKCC